MSLPTYEEATRKPSSRDALQLVSKYIDGCGDLFRCCLVSKEWHDVFGDILWENPLSKITSQANFAKFYTLLPFCTAAAKIGILDNRQWYCDPGDLLRETSLSKHINDFRKGARARRVALWDEEQEERESSLPKRVQDAVHRLATSSLLPNAKFLILNIAARTEFLSLDLLELWDCRPLLLSLEGVHLALEQVAKLGQVQLPFFDEVLYLSLSHSLWQVSTRMRIPPSNFGIFANVAVLKLRNCRLIDRDLTMLRKYQLAPGQLTCLDLRDNDLTDDCIVDLNGFLTQMEREPEYFAIYPYKINSMLEASPQYRPAAADPENPENPRIFHRVDRDVESIPDNVDGFIDWVKEHGKLEVPNTGLRQLYLSGNRLTFRALMSVLDTPRVYLRTFHCDVSPIGFRNEGPWTNHLPEAFQRTSMLDGSPIPLVVALCSHQHAPRLERLSIHHSFVTFSPIQRHPDALLGPGEHTEHGIVNSPNEQYRFLPEVNNNIQYLELIGVPALASEKLLGDLKHFISRAAQAQHHLLVTRLTLPSSRRAPRVLPGLKKLIIVLTSKSEDEPASVTEDEDGETFMRESENDFSFFEGERGRGEVSARDEEVGRQRRHLVDIRAGLAAYRKETREAYEAAKKEHGSWQADYLFESHHHWRGEVVVARSR